MSAFDFDTWLRESFPEASTAETWEAVRQIMEPRRIHVEVAMRGYDPTSRLSRLLRNNLWYYFTPGLDKIQEVLDKANGA